jgi:hypothetical protein
MFGLVKEEGREVLGVVSGGGAPGKFPRGVRIGLG